MSRWTETAAHHSANCLLGAAACLLGAWLEDTLRSACNWGLVAGGGEAFEGRFGISVALPTSAPWALHAVREFGPLLIAAFGFLALVGVARRTEAAVSLAATCAALWFASATCMELLRFGWADGGALELLLQSLGIALGWDLSQGVVAVALAIGALLLLRWGLRRSRLFPLSTFAAPACLVAYLVGGPQVSARGLAGIDSDHLPAIVAVAVATAALYPWRSWQQPAWRTVAAIAVAGALSVAVPLPNPAPIEPVTWNEASSEHWTILFEEPGFTVLDRGAWLRGADARFARYRKRLGLPVQREPLFVHVASSEAAMTALGAGRSTQESFALDASSGAVLMGTPDRLPEDPRAEPLLAMRQAWGEPGSEAVALALARYAVGEFHGMSLQATAARFACEEAPGTVAAALGADADWRSPLWRDAIGGAWAENLASERGPETILDLYRQPAEAALEACPNCLPRCGAGEPRATRSERANTYIKGISFSHEGWAGGGYGSRAAERQLERIKDLGANAVALVPYTFTAAPSEATIRFRTVETDARLARSARRARQLGLAVMLKPHLWSGRQFHGDVSFQDPARFDEWFGDYQRWMLHYARFAELHGVEILVIGNELAGLTENEDAWRGLIAQVRGVFGGLVTYAAHWESELERLTFWDELDYIGVNFYFPIAGTRQWPESDAPEIIAAKRRIAQVQARFQKPVLFTEVGFPALATAASRPWEENSSRLDAELQARCYAVWLEQFALAPNVTGMFWWKWPSHGRGSPFDPSHRPLAKPALGLLEDWFSQL